MNELPVIPPIAVATGISWWKKDAIERLLATGRPLLFEDHPEKAVAAAAQAGGAIAVWPSRAPDGLHDKAAAAGVPLVNIEDGFIRSVGLGSGLHPPSSIILDASGIYYDPRSPSDLETILQTYDFPPELLARAEALRETIVAQGISKYESAAPTAPAPPRTKRTVLVTGQVEDDKSVLAGGGDVRGNQDLLIRARAAEPDAHIIFKPHPDVDAGHRVGRVPDAEILKVADEVVRNESMASLLARVDAVHVLTSLTGFEALLRGLEVTTHGRPFYAGWGLTADLAGPVARRTRRVALPELVAAALILYPRYLDPEVEQLCTPEQLLQRFAQRRYPRETWLTRVRKWQGRIAKLIGTTTD
ncbi:capsule polysaccharide export protein KpsC/LpsZ [Sphingomonas vulcanisoli]|uniref:Capsule polysaccharide export protein KpsC/LpsZ n=1 Tax=Sphingomonas vulcanisoli TaxID=1658060 RepID=A0ABX0TVF4_9SPHN|nr:hypothetical protein [Sphingomonas vulcanisoli]NIJ09426.1 capsule polysaccharide export protein KpsC/LpsZ [Sphingomonas vulcanisoli]